MGKPSLSESPRGDAWQISLHPQEESYSNSGQVAGQLHPQTPKCSDMLIRFTSTDHLKVYSFYASPNSISGSQFQSTPPFSLDRRHDVVVTSLRTRILEVPEQKVCKFSILRSFNPPLHTDVPCKSHAFRDVFVSAGTSVATRDRGSAYQMGR